MTTIMIYAIGALVFSCVIGGSLAFATKPKPENQNPQPARNASPQTAGRRMQIQVRIADKRIATEDTSYKAEAQYSHAAARTNHYFMTFETPEGARSELEIPEAVYCGCLTGFIGTLTYESGETGLRFIDFARDMKYRVNGM